MRGNTVRMSSTLEMVRSSSAELSISAERRRSDPARGLGQTLVGEPVSETVGELLCVEQVARRIRMRVPGQQRQRTDNPVLDRDGDLQAALHATVRFRDHIKDLRLVVVENRCW